ncbi:MAG: HD domain-containing protein, partial [Coriobacteriia bacterium]|nr:HD domain-containing protein [Coriobacteriia bacterium]
DIGAFSLDEHIKTQENDFFDTMQDNHALLGSELLRDFAPLSNAAELIRYHHDEYSVSGDSIPIGSHVIHLADRAVVLLNECNKRGEAFEQIPTMMKELSLRNGTFHPLAFKALGQLSKLEYLWIELSSSSSAFNNALFNRVPFSKEITSLDTLHDFAKIIAHIIDFKSRFTATHSSGVAAVAAELCKIAGFSERDCKLMEIGGLLHDLGKISVPNDILEKKGSLDSREFNTIKKHTYYTYAVLNKIKGLENVAAWAAHHHERADGNGYPFHIKGNDFSKMARVMAVADVTSALTEDRPYRDGMSRDETIKTLYSMAETGAIDKHTVSLVYNNFSHINNVRSMAQHKARKEYERFMNIDHHRTAEEITPIRAQGGLEHPRLACSA